jgi:heme oxygenase
MRSISSVDQYIKLLQFFYSYFSALEDQINNYITIEMLPDYFIRRKTKNMIEDIEYFEGVLPKKLSKEKLPEIKNHLQAFGALYVIEGSTLGGKIISKMMETKLNFNNTKGFTFFNGYGNDTETMWQSFKYALNKQSLNERNDNEIINTANSTFTKFNMWLNEKYTVYDGC